MEKRSKVTKVTKMDKKDSYGNTSFVIEFENADKGFYTSKAEDQKHFVVGQEAAYNIEEKTGSTGKVYFKVTVPQSQKQWSGGGGGKPQIDPKVQMISFAHSYAKDLVTAGKVEVKDLSKTSKEIFKSMVELYNELK